MALVSEPAKIAFGVGVVVDPLKDNWLSHHVQKVEHTFPPLPFTVFCKSQSLKVS